MKELPRYVSVILEDMNSKFDLLLEMMTMMNERMDTLATNESVDDLTKRVDILFVSLKQTNNTVSTHEKRTPILKADSS